MRVLVTGGPDGELAPGDAREDACRLPVAAVIVILQYLDPIERVVRAFEKNAAYGTYS